MNTRYIAKEYRLSHWAQIITEQKESGLTVRAYCEEAGLRENSYYYWQKKLRTAVIDEMTAADGGQSLKGEQTQELMPAMARINLPKGIGSDATDTVSNGCVSIEMFGIKLSASRDYPVSKLSELLRVVSRL